jgi:probable phosphoglycerate mutase
MGSMTTFLLIRHGMTDAVGSTLVGTAPGVHLNAAGRAQAEALVTRLAGVSLSAIVSSPLERARETAAPLAARFGMRVEAASGLIEVDVGEWTGASMAALGGIGEWRRFNTFRSFTRPPGGESMLGVQQRAVAVLLALREQFPAGTIVVVSHGDVIRAVLQYALGIPMDAFHRLEISPGRISVLDLSDEAAIVRQVNGDGLPPVS